MLPSKPVNNLGQIDLGELRRLGRDATAAGNVYPGSGSMVAGPFGAAYLAPEAESTDDGSSSTAEETLRVAGTTTAATPFVYDAYLQTYDPETRLHTDATRVWLYSGNSIALRTDDVYNARLLGAATATLSSGGAAASRDLYILTTSPVFPAAGGTVVPGLVPAAPVIATATKFLREDATWQPPVTFRGIILRKTFFSATPFVAQNVSFTTADAVYNPLGLTIDGSFFVPAVSRPFIAGGTVQWSSGTTGGLFLNMDGAGGPLFGNASPVGSGPRIVSGSMMRSELNRVALGIEPQASSVDEAYFWVYFLPGT